MFGFLWPLAIYVLVLGLQVLGPARWVDGYVLDTATGNRRRYRINGLFVGVVVIGLWIVACTDGWIAWDELWRCRWQSLAGACAIGLAFTFAIVLPAPRRGGLLSDLYLGRIDNPSWLDGRIDAKMSLYLVGAVMLELNVLSFAAHHGLVFVADPSPGVVIYAAMMSFFVADYLIFEHVHPYTYDFFAERVGFKLGWGSSTFYPFFYCVGLWAVADRPNPHTPIALQVASVLIFLAGWTISRGANLQKYHFKTRPEARLLGRRAPMTISHDGKELLCGGFWGLSRHINYLGEILMAIGLTLALGWPLPIVPWLYPLYYVALLVPRQIADDARCHAKYGPLWQEYCRRVPFRIVPWVY